MQTTQIYRIGDCLELLPEISDKSVNLILTDLPYGITKNKWDSIIDLGKLWEQYLRIIKDNAAILLFGQDKFSAILMMSQPKIHKYNLIWNKILASGFLNANRRPMRVHEDILVFYKKQPIYNPQKIEGEKSHFKGNILSTKNNNYGNYNLICDPIEYSKMKYPKSILTYEKPHSSVCIHPTQKPLELIEYLIRTYTDEGDTVHDSCLGSGVVLEACMNLNRSCIGFELLNNWELHYKEILNSKKKSLFNF